MIIQLITCSLVGFSGGLIVGSGIIAFLTVLNIVSRLTHITNTYPYIRLYGWIIWIGTLTGSVISLFSYKLHLPKIIAAGVGAIMGIFVGVIASALAEVLDVIPISAERLNVTAYVRIFLIVLAVGKMVGSLLFWIFPRVYK